MALTFKELYTFEQRKAKYEYQKSKDPNKIPIVCEELHCANKFPELETKRLLVPADITVAQLTYLLRRRMGLSPEETLFIFSGSSVLSSNTLITAIYEKHKDLDGFLYVKYSENNKLRFDERLGSSAFVCSTFDFDQIAFNTKFSTDFEVHRNWLAITSSLPIQSWYSEKGSIWTLDYPPFFAYFEMMLGHLAKYLYPKSVFWATSSYSNSDFECVVFQKLSVIASDFIFYAAIIYRWSDISVKNSRTALMLLILLPSLIMIDHIHFQYNGFLVGILLFCSNSFYKKRIILGSILFTVLVCFKHMFIVLAPVFGLFVLGSIFSMTQGATNEFLLISYSCAKVLLISFLPFALKGRIGEIVGRLFPVQRGLLHSYWAPNFWAVYSFADLNLRQIFLLKPELYQKMFKSSDIPLSTLCNGLVGEKSFSILPDISPLICMIIIAILHVPILYRLLKNRSSDKLVRSVFLSGLISFMFGYHVHEKATIPFVALSMYYYDSFEGHSKSLMVKILIASTVSLLPLMQSPVEICVSISLTLLLMIFANQHHIKMPYYVLSCAGIMAIYLYLKITRTSFQFLPLLTISVSTSAMLHINLIKLYFKELRS